MQDEWRQSRSFPSYEVSESGQIRSLLTGVIRVPTYNNRGILKVNLMHDKKPCTRAVQHIVAEVFLDPPPRYDFTHIIQLNGDRTDCSATNLMWRPKGFTVKYFEQFSNPQFIDGRVPIRDIKTGEVYRRIQDAVMEHGLLMMDIIISMHTRTFVWPTYQQFALLPKD